MAAFAKSWKRKLMTTARTRSLGTKTCVGDRNKHMTGDTTVVLGIEIPSTDPVFITVIMGIDLPLGLACVVAAQRELSEKRRGHPFDGR